MSVQMKLGRWQSRDGSEHKVLGHFPGRFYPWLGEAEWEAWSDTGRYGAATSPNDLVRYLGPVELSPTPACAEAGPACDQAESAKKTLAMMRHEYNALDRWLSAYKALVAQNKRAKDDLDKAIKRLEKEVEG